MIKKLDEQSLQLQLETLEHRYMLAGDVTAVEAGGSLNIDGDDQDNIVLVSQINDQYAVIGVDTGIDDADIMTSFFGVDINVKFFDDITKDVNAKLNGGDDVFLMNGSFQEVELLSFLESDVAINAAEVGRDLKVNTNGGRDVVAILNTNVGRDLKINTGFGFEDVVVVGGAGAITGILDFSSEYHDEILGGSGALLGELGFWADSTVSFVGHDIDFEEVGEAIGDIFGEVVVGRDLKIFGGSSHDYIYVGGVEIGRDATIETGLGDDNIYFGAGAVVQIYGNDFFDGQEGGGLPYYVNLSNFGISGEVFVGRNALFLTSMGEDFVMVGGGVDYGFDLPTFETGFPWPVATVSMNGGAQIGKDLRIDTGQHDDVVLVANNPVSNSFGDAFDGDDMPISIYDVNVGRDMKIFTNEEDDIVEIGSSRFEDDFGGDNDLFFGAPSTALLFVGRNAVIDTGTGKDELFMGQAAFLHSPTLLGGDEGGENGDTQFFMIYIGRDLDIRTGTHDDYVEISGAQFFNNWSNSLGTLFVGRDMDVNVDGGNDVLIMVGNGDANPTASVGGFGGGPSIYVGDDLDVQTGNQDDNVEINRTHVTDDTDIQTSFGRDNLTISDSYLGSKVEIDTGAERDTVDILYSDIADDLEISTDFGDDKVFLYSTYVGGDVDIETSRGNDWVEMLYSSVDESITIETGKDEDSVEIFGVNASDLEVDTGDEDDNVCAFDSMFSDGAEFDLGDGDNDGISHNLMSAEVVNEEGPGDCNILP